MSDPPLEAKLPPAPRTTTADDFEQNPLATVHSRRQDPELTPEQALSLPEDDRVREAVRRVIQEGAPISVVARELHLSTSSIRAWKSRYASFLEEASFGESNPDAATEDVVIDADAQLKFSNNWQRLLEMAHVEETDFKQDPLEVFLQTSTGTSWLYDDDGELDRFTLIGATTAVLGLLAVVVFLLADRGKPPPPHDYTVRDLPTMESSLKVELDVFRASQVVQQFLRADGYLSKLRYLKDRDLVAPLVKEYYQRHDAGAITDAIATQSMEGANLFSLSFEIPSREATWFFNAVQAGDSYEIDWFTSTIYQTDNLQRFVEARSTAPTTIHVMLTRGDYYNYQWSDKEASVCFSLTFPGFISPLYGYAPRQSDLGIDLQLMTVLEPSHAAVLEVRYPEAAPDARQVEILHLVSKDWLPQP